MQEKIKCALKNAITTAINCNDSDNFCSVIGIINTDEIRDDRPHRIDFSLKLKNLVR